MNEKYTSLEELMNTPYKFDKYDFNKYKDYTYDKYIKDYDRPYNPFKEEKRTITQAEYEDMIRRFMKMKPKEDTWREELDNMPIGFIEKYLRKKKLANIKQEEE